VVHLALCFNPSHLEFVNPVAMGRVRAKQDRLGDIRRDKGMAILIHGDAAFAGEGIVQETLNLSQLNSYRVGGTLHIIVNNQIGFTTPPDQARSTVYASDVAKMLQIPIFLVNGEDPEAVAQVIKLSMEFRRTFKRDVVIDMYCYRRHGHNEGDEPSFTQPLMYKAIKERMSVRDSYLQHLLQLGGVTQQEADEIAERRRATLEAALAKVREQGKTNGEKEAAASPNRPSILGRVWRNYRGGLDTSLPDVATGIDRERAVMLLQNLTRLPQDFHPHPKIARFLAQRTEMANGEQPLDWSAGETLALASLATEGVRIRLTGQDSIRGTFSHRHAVFYDSQTGEPYMPLANLAEEQGPVEIVNSPLCEAGVLGFEYGYSIAYPDALVMWEAQFGDFANCAQVMIDQGITSGEDKWKSLTGLVMLLPHGFEGMGPEHSSARLERFLQLAAEDNIQVIYPTTPAQFFHALRRQVHRPWRKPLIVMTPKSMLRLPAAASPLEEFTEGTFQRIIPDAGDNPEAVERIILCSGKIYYDLIKERDENQRDDVAIIRVEQIFPLRQKLLTEILSVYRENTPVLWVQEEPENMGAWRFLRCLLGFVIADRYPLYGVFRPASASPATGSGASHRYEQERLVRKAFDAYYAVPDMY
jgi:2-oxoglutarate dehydrogenase E1 component